MEQRIKSKLNELRQKMLTDTKEQYVKTEKTYNAIILAYVSLTPQEFEDYAGELVGKRDDV